MAAPRKTVKSKAIEPADDHIGRFYQLQREVAPKRKGPYQLTADIFLTMPSKDSVDQFREAATTEDKFRALLGDSYEAVDALFGPEGQDLWLAFQADFYAHFFGQGANQLPGGS